MKKLFATALIITSIFTASTVKANILSDLTKEVKAQLITKAEEKVNSFINELLSEQNQQTTVNSDEQNIITELGSLEFVSGQSDIVVINNNVPTFTYQDFSTPAINYSNLDNLNRASQAMAYLTKQNLVKSEGREGQTFLPTGFHKNGKQDRGHLIAYTISGAFDNNGQFNSSIKEGSTNNPLNLFTQTSSSNRGSMQEFENQVRNALKNGSKVIYKVTPIFKNDELMARGVWLEAVSNDNSVSFNVYLHNVADGYRFDYMTGRKTSDKTMIVADN